MQIEFIGAAQTVTGSKHLVSTRQASVLLDCGLFQGRRRESLEKNRSLGVDAHRLDAVVLSHAHIDHSGALPILVKQGFKGPIYATPATRDLCAAMLIDAAMIQEADARYINKVVARGDATMERVEPLYDTKDVAATLRQMVSVPYHMRKSIASGVELTFLDAGHMLGSALSVLDLEERAERRRLVYTGDLGRKNLPILRDPEVPDGTQVLLMESTYGDRKHQPFAQAEGALALLLERAFARGGKVIIPSFALERAQEIIYALKHLKRIGRLPKMPVYVDSPLTVSLTDVFRLHPECYDDETRALIQGSDSPFVFDELRYVSEVADSKAIDAAAGPAVIISASGMCEGGRVLHHLKACVEDPRNIIAIVGFQAQHTLGRRIVERRPRVKIFGVERELRAEVVTLNGMSAHADQTELLAFANAVRDRGALKNVILVHGETKAQTVLSAALNAHAFASVHIPARGERIAL
jgi:metallo-beta-lactamase family protein